MILFPKVCNNTHLHGLGRFVAFSFTMLLLQMQAVAQQNAQQTGTAQTHSADPIAIFGDLKNEGTFSNNTGRLFFNGTTRQRVGGSEIMDFEYVTLNNANHLQLDTTFQISRELMFQNGQVATPYDIALINAPPPVYLHFLRGATYQNATDARHVRGYVARTGIDSFRFPIGDGVTLRPVMISAGTTPSQNTFWAAYYKESPHASGLDTSLHETYIKKISDIELWDIDGDDSTQITLTWNANSNIAALVGTRLTDLIVTGWDGLQWVNLGNTGNAGNIAAGQIRSKRIIPSDYTAFTFAKGNYCIEVKLFAFLEGALDTNNMRMTTALNQRGLLPGQTPIGMFASPTPAGHPYNRPPWLHNGPEDVVNYDPTVVDWVLISLRANNSASTTVWKEAALIHADGRITLTKPCNTIPNDRPYYIVIEHRNHVGVMTNKAIPIVADTLRFDFRKEDGFVNIDPPSTGQKQRGGAWAMLAADGKKDTRLDNFDVNFRDKLVWRGQNGNFDVYRDADFNLDADVNFLDVGLWRLNTGKHSAVPHQ